MRGWVLAGLLLAGLVGPASALAVTDGNIDIVSRPSGFGPLPFDGINLSQAAPHALSSDGCHVVFTSDNDVLSAIDDNKGRSIYVADRCTPGNPIQLVSTTQAGAAANGDSSSPSISADGQKVAFRTTARNLLPPGTTVDNAIVVKDLADGSVTTASRGDGATGAVAEATQGVISGDGSAVAFAGYGAVHASNADGSAGHYDVYVRYLGTNATRMASVTKTANARGGSDGPFDINYDGTAVALITDAALDSSDGDGQDDVYLARSVNSGTVQIDWVSYTVNNTSGAQTARYVAIAGDGNHVAFANNRVWTQTCTPSCGYPSTSQYTDSITGPTGSPDVFGLGFPAGSGAPTHVFWTTDRALKAEDTNGEDDLYVRDLSNLGSEAGLSMPVPHAAGGVFGADVRVGDVAIFEAVDTALPGTDGVRPQVFAHAGGTTTPLSLPPGETRRGEVYDTSTEQRHAVSDAGRFVVMETTSPALGAVSLAPGDFWNTQIIVRDVAGGTTTVASMGTDGKPANRYADTASIDGTGDRVAFETAATNLVPGTTNDVMHVYVRDLVTGTTQRIDHLADGSAPTGDAHDAVLSLDGTKVVFISGSPGLPDADGHDHAYLADLATGSIAAVDRTQAGVLGDGDVTEVDTSTDGSRVAFISYATNLAGAPSERRVYVKDVGSGALTFASVPQSGDPGLAAHALTLSPDGSHVGWVENSAGFGYGSDGLQHVFVRDLAAGTTTLASVGGPPSPGAHEQSGELDGSGSHLAFTRVDATGVPSLLLRDLTAGSTVDLLPGVGPYNYEVSISPDGHCLAVNSNAANILASGNPSPDFDQVYLKAVGADCPHVPPPGGGPGGGENPDRTPPVISGLRMTRRRFAVAAKRTALVSRAKRGSAFRFTLSEPARTSIAIARALPGRRSGKRCLKPRKGLKRRCTRYAVVATLTRTKTKQGANTVAFTGRLGARRLKPGTYRATVGAVDAAGNRAVPRRVTFRIVRR